MLLTTKKIKPALALALGVGIVVATVVVNLLALPASTTAGISSGLVLLAGVYGVGGPATRALIAKLNPHVIAVAAAILAGAAALLPVVNLGVLPQTIAVAVVTAVAALLPGASLPLALPEGVTVAPVSTPIVVTGSPTAGAGPVGPANVENVTSTTPPPAAPTNT